MRVCGFSGCQCFQMCFEGKAFWMCCWGSLDAGQTLPLVAWMDRSSDLLLSEKGAGPDQQYLVPCLQCEKCCSCFQTLDYTWLWEWCQIYSHLSLSCFLISFFFTPKVIYEVCNNVCYWSFKCCLKFVTVCIVSSAELWGIMTVYLSPPTLHTHMLSTLSRPQSLGVCLVTKLKLQLDEYCVWIGWSFILM